MKQKNKQTKGSSVKSMSMYPPEDTPVLSKSQKEWHNLIKLYIGEKEPESIILVTPKILIDFIDRDLNTALFMSQLIYWSTRSNMSCKWIYKTKEDWYDELGLKRSVLDGILKYLYDNKGWIHIGYKKAINGSNTCHFRVTDKFNIEFEQFILQARDNIQRRNSEELQILVKPTGDMSEPYNPNAQNQHTVCQNSTGGKLESDKTCNKDYTKTTSKVGAQITPKMVPPPILETSPFKVSGPEIEKQEQEQSFVLLPLQEPKVQVSLEEIKKEEQKEEQKEPSKPREDTPMEKTQVLQVFDVQEQNEPNNRSEHQSINCEDSKFKEFEIEYHKQYSHHIEKTRRYVEPLVDGIKLFADEIDEFTEYLVNRAGRNVYGEITWDMAYSKVMMDIEIILQDYRCDKGREREIERELIRTNPDNIRPSNDELLEYESKINRGPSIELSSTNSEQLRHQNIKYKMEKNLFLYNQSKYKKVIEESGDDGYCGNSDDECFNKYEDSDNYDDDEEYNDEDIKSGYDPEAEDEEFGKDRRQYHKNEL